MNKVLKRLFEKIAKIIAIILWSSAHPKEALILMWKSEKSGPYISAFILTAIALVFTVSHDVLRIYSNLVVYGFAIGMFLILSIVLKCLPNDDEDRGRVPLRKETRVLYSILLPVILLVPIVTFIAYKFPVPIPWAFFGTTVPAIVPVAIFAVIIVIGWSVLNYRSYNKK